MAPEIAEEYRASNVYAARAMSNCFSLASAGPFFNLLTASKQEEERRRMKEREREREEGVKRYEINEHLEFLVLLGYSAKLGKYARREQWEAETLDEEASYILPFLLFFSPFFSPQPGVVKTEGGPRWATDQWRLTSWQDTSSKPAEAVWIPARAKEELL